ncbi:hypothetical protein Pan14r_54740 [Crateriforma conspicua]|uniref:Uncharacterized protein n=1 Tax=Crateriforma conspicua TaxID=2527996 RepID=A0A5C5XQZ9_9PLAN|nr:hypothetical protein Pan14r_54740 [Crateriforma conspicua]
MSVPPRNDATNVSTEHRCSKEIEYRGRYNKPSSKQSFVNGSNRPDEQISNNPERHN